MSCKDCDERLERVRGELLHILGVDPDTPAEIEDVVQACVDSMDRSLRDMREGFTQEAARLDAKVEAANRQYRETQADLSKLGQDFAELAEKERQLQYVIRTLQRHRDDAMEHAEDMKNLAKAGDAQLQSARELIGELVDNLKPLVEDEPCDHSVNICWCSAHNVIDTAEAYLGTDKK